MAAQLRRFEALYAIESSEELAAALRGRTEREFAAARDFGVLMVEFSLYAMRNPPPRPSSPNGTGSSGAAWPS